MKGNKVFTLIIEIDEDDWNELELTENNLHDQLEEFISQDLAINYQTINSNLKDI